MLVVSRGDEELLKLDGRRRWHFPGDRGRHLGRPPPGRQRARRSPCSRRCAASGGEFLLVPEDRASGGSTTTTGSREHLESRYRDRRARRGDLRDLRAERSSERERPSLLDRDPGSQPGRPDPPVPRRASSPSRPRRRSRSIVVDDASTDSTAERAGRLRRARPGGHASRQRRLRRPPATTGRAQAPRRARSSSSTTTRSRRPAGSTRWSRYADEHPAAAVVGSKLLFPNDTVQHAGVVICQDGNPRHIYAGFPGDHPAVNKSRRFQAVTAACMLVRRGAFEQAGGFDPAFRNCLEDADLCLRLRRARPRGPLLPRERPLPPRVGLAGPALEGHRAQRAALPRALGRSRPPRRPRLLRRRRPAAHPLPRRLSARARDLPAAGLGAGGGRAATRPSACSMRSRARSRSCCGRPCA